MLLKVELLSKNQKVDFINIASDFQFYFVWKFHFRLYIYSFKVQAKIINFKVINLTQTNYIKEIIL